MRDRAPAAKHQFRGSHLPQKPLLQMGLRGPGSQAEAWSPWTTARYNYQLEKDNVPRIYRGVEATKTGGKGSKRKKKSSLYEKEQVKGFHLKNCS